MVDQEHEDYESFEALLEWLDPNRDEAWEKYYEIWDRLLKIFTYKRCADIEELAGEVIKRVERKVPELVKTYVGDPKKYFFGVAHKLVLEQRRRNSKFSEFQEETESGASTRFFDEVELEVDDVERESFDACLARLSEKDRELILAYYEYDSGAKLSDRKRLAERFDLSMGALWTRVSRIRSRLNRCIKDRLDHKAQVQ